MSFQKIANAVAAKEAKLIVVAKNRSVLEIQNVVDAGAEFLAFNRVLEGEEKFPLLQNFHGRKILIGHLQTNKVKKALAIFDEIHSVDSERLAQKLSAEAENLGKILPVLIQINVDQDEHKFGFSPEEFESSAKKLALLKHLEIRGMMTIGKLDGDPRETFSALKNLFEKISSRGIFDKNFREISMGMSGDWEIALEYGATMVRVGSALF